ncbi:Ret finger protein-like 4A-like protein 1, partial [Eschrichtius robustus]|nr:Ret finger protein-like 4A-like protein 1 [Eschrichtius robustus]
MDCSVQCMYLLIFLSTVDVTLDVDTANKYLIISEDLKTVRCGFFKQKKRSRPERFSRTTCVLGFPLFTSGRHYWEVDLGSSQEWDVGVCKESVRRRGKTQLAPDLGFWTVCLRNGDAFSAHTVPSTVLKTLSLKYAFWRNLRREEEIPSEWPHVKSTGFSCGPTCFH